MEQEKNDLEKICAWLPCYEAALSKGYPLDDYIEMGCYLCSGKPAFCDAYFPRSSVKKDYKHVDSVILYE